MKYNLVIRISKDNPKRGMAYVKRILKGEFRFCRNTIINKAAKREVSKPMSTWISTRRER